MNSSALKGEVYNWLSSTAFNKVVLGFTMD